MRMKLALSEERDPIEFEVIYSRRKTIAIKIDSAGNIKVCAPQGTSRGTIAKTVSGKAAWIIKHLQKIQFDQAQALPRKYTDGELFMYLGREYPLQLDIDQEYGLIEIILAEGRFLVKTPAGDKGIIKSSLEAWYRHVAAGYIKGRLDHYQSLLHVSPSRIAIRNQKTRWGSCSNKGSLNFNWRLMMAPAEVVDYVVVHELCHLVHPNHSKNFWNQVSAVLPDYRVRKDWLKKNSARLDW